MIWQIGDNIYLNPNITALPAKESNIVADDFILRQNYPNPFNQSTTIEYELSKPAYVRLDIFDVRGRKVVSLVNKYQFSGLHSVNWDGFGKKGNKLASGIYIYRLTVIENSQTLTKSKTMFLAK